MLPVFLSHSKLIPAPLTIAIIVPTWNERASIDRMLAALRALENDCQIVFADGGSTDGTVEWLRAEGATVIAGPRGRGAQMNAGAEAVAAQILWFLHADCPPEPNAPRALLTTIRQGAVGGYCRLAFRDGGLPGGCMTWLYPKLARLGLVYGDAGIFVTREAYQAVGGYREWPLFEDLDFLRRLRRRYPAQIRRAETVVRPSARRFGGFRFPVVLAQWALLHLLYWAGVPPRWLDRLYRPVRQERRRVAA